MRAQERLVEWLKQQAFVDRHGLLPPGLKLQYHSRSDEHSKKLGEFIVDDLLDECEILREQARLGQIGYGINYRFCWPNGKVKTLDLAIGLAASAQPPLTDRIRRLTGRSPADSITRLFVACEEKATMTEHGKSQPRIFSELNDAHTNVHQGSRDTIATGITMLNIAETFISPLRQRPDQPPVISMHRQPDVTASMVEHLRRLPIRHNIDTVGLDAYCTFVVDVNNQGHVALHEGPPAAQPGDPDHYDSFVTRISALYSGRYVDLNHLPEPASLSVEEALRQLASSYPGLLRRAAELVIAEQRGGARELYELAQTIDPDAGETGHSPL